jgi:hypothetical protein
VTKNGNKISDTEKQKIEDNGFVTEKGLYYLKNDYTLLYTSGKVLKVTDKKVNVAITLNNKTIEVPLNYTFENNQLVAKGTIDVFDFSLNDQLKKLNKACFALHEGKTWNDVNIEISATTQNTQCK